MRDLNDEYNSTAWDDPTDGPSIEAKPIRINPAQFQRDLLDALLVLAFHCKRTTRDAEAWAEIDHCIDNVERHLR